MIKTTEIIQHLDSLLKPQRFRDYAPNGLQVEGAPTVRRLVTAVSASQAAIDFAIAEGAQALLVHHGYFWKGEALPLTGLKRRRLEALIWHAEIQPIGGAELAQRLGASLGRAVLALGPVPEQVTRISWCTGAAQDYFQRAIAEGAQVFISGEYAERSYHEANELGALYLSCGHHASERAGVRALGQYLGEEFGLEVAFFDEPNPL